jgi:hypothetical protein
MSYTKQIWKNGSAGNTPIDASHLQHIEDGIEAAASTADSAAQTASAGLSQSYADAHYEAKVERTAGSSVGWVAALGTDGLLHLASPSAVDPETVQDIIGAMLVAGNAFNTNLTFSYDDANARVVGVATGSGGGGGTATKQPWPFYFHGTATASITVPITDGKGVFFSDATVLTKLRAVIAEDGTSPTGAALKYEVRLSGGAVLGTISIPAGTAPGTPITVTLAATTGSAPFAMKIPASSIVNIYCTQVGSTAPGSNVILYLETDSAFANAADATVADPWAAIFGTDLVEDWDADLLTSLADGAAVPSWPGKKGVYTWAQSDSTKQPHMKTGWINGHRAVYTDQVTVNKWMKFVAATSPFTTEYTVIAVARPENQGYYINAVPTDGSGGNPWQNTKGFSLGADNDDKEFSQSIGDSSGATAYAASGVAWPSEPNNYGLIYTRSATDLQTWQVSGGSALSAGATAATLGTLTAQTWHLGIAPDEGNGSNTVGWTRIILIKKRITPTQLSQVVALIQSQYGV